MGAPLKWQESEMTDSIKMEIADINLSLDCQNAVILRDPEPAYKLFSAKGNKSRDTADVEIRLELGSMPDTAKLATMFESGQSWSMFRDGDDYLFELKPMGFSDQPVWLARVNPNFTHATVYCSEKLISEKNGRLMVSNPVRYPLDQLLLMYVLARKEGALLHGAGININGRGLIFPGKSGAGKSTLSRQFVSRNDLEVLSDDRIAIRKLNGEFRAFGTPWPGEEGIARNKSMPLSGVLFLYHGESNRITEISPREALNKLLPVISIPWFDPEIMQKILLFCEDLVSRVAAFELHFQPSFGVVEFLEEFVSKAEKWVPS